MDKINIKNKIKIESGTASGRNKIKKNCVK